MLYKPKEQGLSPSDLAQSLVARSSYGAYPNNTDQILSMRMGVISDIQPGAVSKWPQSRRYLAVRLWPGG
jgi:hypothetical protein